MMMGRDWLFVQNPKAGSSSISRALDAFVEPVPPRQLPRGKPRSHDQFDPRVHPWREHRLGVVRNPWDRMVSAWAYLRERKPKEYGDRSFEAFVLGDEPWTIGGRPDNLLDFKTTPQIYWLAMCNHILRFETLDRDFERWSERVLGRAITPEHTNRSRRSGGWIGYYTPAMRDRVAAVFELDIRAFGYSFNPHEEAAP